jgi:hypothetical protein
VTDQHTACEAFLRATPVVRKEDVMGLKNFADELIGTVRSFVIFEGPLTDWLARGSIAATILIGAREKPRGPRERQ